MDESMEKAIKYDLVDSFYLDKNGEKYGEKESKKEPIDEDKSQ